MNTDNQFFSLNHVKHFRLGLCNNLATEENSLIAKNDGGAMFISHSLDSCERGNRWHRARMDIESEGAWFALSFYASDIKRVVLADGTNCDLDALIKTDLLSADEKSKLLSESGIWQQMTDGASDVLLHEIQGRYLWVMLQIRGKARLSRIRLYYPMSGFEKYLPESYRDGEASFWTRFIAVFQSVYLDNDEKIAAFPSELNPLSASGDALGHLSRWLGLDNLWELGQDKMRLLIRDAAKLYRRWGTRVGMSETLRLVCGQTPYILEHFLTGGDPFGFTILLHSDEFTIRHQKLIADLVGKQKPAHTAYNLVILKESVILDSHCYLGVNSKLSGYPKIKIDGRTALSAHSL